MRNKKIANNLWSLSMNLINCEQYLSVINDNNIIIYNNIIMINFANIGTGTRQTG